MHTYSNLLSWLSSWSSSSSLRKLSDINKKNNKMNSLKKTISTDKQINSFNIIKYQFLKLTYFKIETISSYNFAFTSTDKESFVFWRILIYFFLILSNNLASYWLARSVLILATLSLIFLISWRCFWMCYGLTLKKNYRSYNSWMLT